MSRVVYPLRFYTRLPIIAQALQNAPGTSTIDASAAPSAYMIPICLACSTGEGIVREEENDMHRYRCTVCGRATLFKPTIGEAAEEWAMLNMMESSEPTN